jgi:hypothetical protein
MSDLNFTSMILLAGEQAAPNLLPARHFRPQQVLILHSNFPKSIAMAQNLKMLLTEMNPELEPIDDFDVRKIREQIQALVSGLPSVMVNVTGGTKPMSIGALEAVRHSGAQAIYVRSQGAKTEVDFYGFDEGGSTFVRETKTLQGTISLNDYLVAYFGDKWKPVGFGTGPGESFERAIHDALLTGVDERMVGWRDASNQVDVDFVIRCNNQIGIIQAKSKKEARKMDGIKQLAVAGGQRFFGTYVRRFLVIDRQWGKNELKLRELCKAMEITLVEIPGFTDSAGIDADGRVRLLESVHAILGKPMKESNP